MFICIKNLSSTFNSQIINFTEFQMERNLVPIVANVIVVMEKEESRLMKMDTAITGVPGLIYTDIVAMLITIRMRTQLIVPNAAKVRMQRVR